MDSTYDKNIVKVEVANDNIQKEASPLNLINFSKDENSRSLWNGLDSTHLSSINVKNNFQTLVAQDFEEVARTSIYLDENESFNSNQQYQRKNAFNQSIIANDANTIENLKVKFLDKNIPSQEGRTKVDSPTSVFNAIVSMAPRKDVLSNDIVDIIIDDTTFKQPSFQVTCLDNLEGMEMHQSIFDLSIYKKEALQLQSVILDLQSLNNEGEIFLNGETLQLESAISDLYSLNNTLKKISEEVYLPKSPSSSPEALYSLEGGVSPQNVCKRLCPSNASSPSSETELTHIQHLIEENMVLKELVNDVLKWNQWQSLAILSLHKMMEKLALDVLETKTIAKKTMKTCKQVKYKKVVKKKNKA